MKYTIFEGNLDRLEKKLARIEKKCKKYGADFHYEVVGEEYRKVETEDGVSITRFVIVDVEGFAKINDWEFVGTVDHRDNENVIRNIIDVAIPERYRTSDCYCEHCSTKRRRKNTFLIHNTQTGEFKQVGRSCLRDYTGGYDAELAASYISLHDSLIEAENHESSSPYFGFFNEYHDLIKILKMSKAIITKLGFVSSSAEFGTPSKASLFDLDSLLSRGPSMRTRYLIDEGVTDYYESSNDGEYIKNLRNYYMESEENSNYMRNLKTIFSSDWCKNEDFGYIVSAVYVYDRKIESEKKKAKLSNYIGEIKDKIEVKIVSCACVSYYKTDFGYSYLFKFIDEDGNCLMWSTGKSFDTDMVIKLKGTVKDHKEYNGTKQTWVTRCKITERTDEEEAC